MKCDELKVHKAYNRWIDEEMPTPNDDLICNEVYLKSEADKVSAELKAQKAQAEDDCAYWKTMAQKNAEDNVVMAKQRAEAFKRERHHKYKRCLTMARWCESEAYIHEHGSEYDEKLVAWFGKWYERWLKIAEQFKDKEAK